MNAARTLSVALALTLGACSGGQVQRPAATVVSAGPRYAPGELHLHALEWTAEAVGARTPGLPDGVPVAGGLRLRGELALQRVDGRPGETLLALWFTRLDEHELVALGEPIAVDGAGLVGVPVTVALADDGTLTRAWYPPEAPSLLRHVMGGLLARLDLRAAAAGARTVPVAHGIGEAVYTGEAGKLQRTLQRLVRFDAAQGAAQGAALAGGVAAIDFDDRGALSSLVAEERVRAEADGFASEDRFSLIRVAVVPGELLPRPELERMLAIDPAAPPDPTEAEQVLAQRFAEDMDLHGVARGVQNLDNGLLPYAGDITQMVGLLRGWPERTPEVAALARKARSSFGRGMVFDLLATASTTESQASFRALLADPVAAPPGERAGLFQRFVLMARPDSASGWFVLDHYDAADDAQRPALLYPAGALAGRLRDADPWVAGLLHERLLTALAEDTTREGRIAALAGLGNAAWSEDRGRVLAHLDDPDEQVRLAAIEALRELPGEDTTQALFAALADPEPRVAAQALASLHERQLGPADSARLAALVDGSPLPGELQQGLLAALGERLGDDPDVPEALRRLAAVSEDASLRARVGRLLARQADPS